MINLIDTHFHLDFYKNHKEIYKKINELKQYTICMTNSPEVYQECQRLYFNTKYIKFALGFNPKEKHFADSFWLFKNKFKGADYIGEVGLDFSRLYRNTMIEQTEIFRKIVEMCSTDNKLLSVHLKQSENAAIEIIEEYLPKKCIIHWFSGREEQLKKLVDLGCYFSVNCNMLENNKIKLIPQNKILIESDGPFTKIKGKKYEPSLLREQYELISEFLEIKDLEKLIYNNFKNILTA